MTTRASNSCPDESTLLPIAAGQSLANDAMLATHLQLCNRCQDRLASLKRQIAIVRRFNPPDGADDLSTRVDETQTKIVQLQVDRVREAVWRGWLRPKDISSVFDGANSGKLPLDSLLKSGALTGSQIRSLESMCRAIPIHESENVFNADRLFAIARQGESARAAVNDCFQPGTIVAERFLIRGVLGQGGFGLVLLAEDRGSGELVALKTPLFRTSSDEQEWSLELGSGLAHRAELFHREVHRWLRLELHSHVVAAWELFEHRKRPFLVMQYIEGCGTLTDLIQENGGDWKTALDVAYQISAALEHVWSHAGLVHRDIKPDNILVTSDGRAMLTDFGLSMIQRSDGPDHQLAGTPAYMAPELWGDPQASAVLADVFSFGVTIFEAITGAIPTPAHAKLVTHAAELPVEFGKLIVQCIHSTPEERPSYAEISKRLGELVRSHNRPIQNIGKPDQQTQLRWLVHRSESFARLGQPDEALKLAKRALRANRHDIGACHAAGNACLLMGKPQIAEQYLLKAHSADEGNFVAAGSLANMYHKTGRTAEAVHWLDRTISLVMAEGRPEYLRWYSDIVVDTKSADDALRLCQQIVQAAPDAAVVWNNMAILLRRSGDYTSARESAQRAVEINPTYAKAWVNLANALLSGGAAGEGLDAANRALQFDDELQGAWAARATALVHLGRIQEARETLKRGLIRLPLNPLLTKGLLQLPN